MPNVPPRNNTPSQPEYNFNNAGNARNPLNETTVIFPTHVEETVYLAPQIHTLICREQ